MKTSFIHFLPLLWAFGFSSIGLGAPSEKPEPKMTHPAATGVEDPKLAALLEQHWESMMERWPTWATKLGDHRYDDRLAKNTPEAWEESRAGVTEWLSMTDAIDSENLSPNDRVTWQVIRNEFSTAQAKAVCRTEEWQASPMSNTFSSLNHLGELHPLRTPEDGANLISRYAAIPTYMDGAIASLRLGMKADRVPNKESVRRTIDIIDAELGRAPEQWALNKPAAADLSAWPEASRSEFRTAIQAAVQDHARPAFTRYRDFLKSELMPAARGQDKAGVGWLPDGQACYAAAIQEQTTLSISAEEIHATGLRELESIHAEFRTLGKRLWEEEDLSAIFERLRTDEALFFDTPDAVQAKADEALARANAAAPSWFGILPKTPCVVVPIPEF